MSKLLSKPKKKMKKLLTNKRKGYSKLMVKHETKNAYSNDYEDEDLEMEVELNYDMNASYNYQPDPKNELSTVLTTNTTHQLTTSQPIPEIQSTTATSITQTYLDDIMDKGIARKTEYCVVPFYLLVSILSIMTTALLCINEISTDLGMIILNGFTLIGAIIGMYGVYAWGTFDDVLSYLTKQNTAYKDNIDRLNSMGEVLQNDVDDINTSIELLKRDGNILENTMKTYQSLKDELQTICDKNDGNQDVMDLLNTFNDQCENLEAVIEDNEKAHLLSIFYSVKLYDYGNNNCLNLKQYKQFLMHCNSKTRKKFEMEGGFDAMDTKNTGFVDMQDFERMVHKVLNVTIQESQHLLNSSIKIQEKL